MKTEKTNTEEFSVNAKELIDEVKKIFQAGTARKIILKNEKGDEFMSIPVPVAIVGVIFAPLLAGIGAAAALMTSCTIVVVKKEA